MNNSFRTYLREDDILVFEFQDTTQETVKEWFTFTMSHLDKNSQPNKALYDMRALSSISIYALNQGIKIAKHPNNKWVYSVALITNPQVAYLANTVTKIYSGGRQHIMSDLAEAVTWLNSKVPVKTPV